MPKAVVHQQQRYLIDCPSCGAERAFEVTHLWGMQVSFGPWPCSHCGKGIRGVISGYEVEIEKTGGSMEDSLVLLKLPPQEQNILLVTKGRLIDGDDQHDQYHFESHTCPVNFLRETQKIIIGDDDDPHGLFKYCGTAAYVDTMNMPLEEILFRFDPRSYA